jgi:protein-disulfide isomerase
LTDLRSAPVPPVARNDHVRGHADGTVVIEYGDFECPYCAALCSRLHGQERLRLVFRHFPVRSSHPRAWAAACAAEAAALQGRFWEMHDSLFDDQGRLDDPHLWRRARELGLDVDRFDLDRRSDGVADRVLQAFRGGVRAGVVTTPTLFAGGQMYPGAIDLEALVPNDVPEVSESEARGTKSGGASYHRLSSDK